MRIGKGCPTYIKSKIYILHFIVPCLFYNCSPLHPDKGIPRNARVGDVTVGGIVAGNVVEVKNH
jgi:hypothetical protein